MAKYTYRFYGEGQWMSSSGSGIFAVLNKAGSGKKISIKSLELYDSTSLKEVITAGGKDCVTNLFTLGYVTEFNAGEEFTPSPLDTAASWPSAVKCYKTGSVTPTTTTFARAGMQKALTLTTGFTAAGGGLPILFKKTPAQPHEAGATWGSVWNKRSNSNVTPIIIKPNQTLAVYCGDTGSTFPIVVTVKLVRQGSPKRTFVSTYYRAVLADFESICTIYNPSGSGENIEFHALDIEECGTFDTPYLQLVPISRVDAASVPDNTRKVSVVKMDTASPDFSTNWGQIYVNCPVFPQTGIPWEYASPGGGATPKGFNYFHSKDFVGPAWGAWLPETIPNKGGSVIPTTMHCGFGRSGADLFNGRAPLVLREGQGVAMVSGAETATTGLSMAGWQSVAWGMTLIVESAVSPSLTLIGLQTGSDIVVLNAGTTTSYVDVDAHPQTSYSWGYDPDAVSSVDVCIYKIGYVPFIVRALTLNTLGATIPVQQVADRAYSNP